MEVFSAWLLHILVITIIKTMLLSNKSPKGSNDCASNWLRKKTFSVQSSGTSSFWKVSKMMFQVFYPVSGRLSEHFKVCMQSTASAEVRTQLMHRLQAVLSELLK